MSGTCDILGLGCIAVDEFLFLDTFPEEDAKEPVHQRLRQCGGLTATALVAASRLGAHCAYAGRMGDDPDSRFVAAALRAEGVDLQQAQSEAAARPYLATILVNREQSTRTILFQRPEVIGPTTEWPPVEVICSARVLFVDHMGLAGQVRAAGIARRHGIPVVADCERANDETRALIAMVDHPILPWAAAQAFTGAQTPAGAVDALWDDQRQTVIVTTGAEGCWYRDAGAPGVHHQQAFSVDVVDTTGCGDVFHGAYAAGLAAGLPVVERVRQAAAAAAIKATAPGGQTGCPTHNRVEKFLSSEVH